MSTAVLAAAYTPRELALASAGAALVQSAFLALLFVFGHNAKHITELHAVPPMATPIRVKPVMDDAPLLKLGGKPVRTKLPDMWQKQTPIKRVEAASAPSPQAAKTPEAIPTSAVATADAQAPPPDAEIVAKADPDLQKIDAAPPDAAPTVEGPGSADGVKEGTETDPLKARAVSQYRMKIIGWFNARFHRPDGEIPCEELKKLSAGVVAQIGGDRSVASYNLTRPSGNAVFDARVKAALDSAVGQQLPPPPPLYPDILESTISTVFSGAGAKCE